MIPAGARGAVALLHVALITGCGSVRVASHAQRHAWPQATPQSGRRAHVRHRPAAHPAALSLPTTRSVLAGSDAGVAVAPLDGSRVRVVGRLRGVHAWSTMKVPLIAALLRARRDGALPGGTRLTPGEHETIARAILDSDNAAAQRLYDELSARYGGDRPAVDRIQAELERAGDVRTQVHATSERPAFSNYGQTHWPLAEIARFYRSLARGCLLGRSDTAMVLGYMRGVHAIQDWGARAGAWPAGTRVAVKGGWGPTRDGEPDYDVLQAAVVDDGHGRGAVIVMATSGHGTTFASGTAGLSALAAAVARDLRPLPGGRSSCR